MDCIVVNTPWDAGVDIVKAATTPIGDTDLIVLLF